METCRLFALCTGIFSLLISILWLYFDLGASELSHSVPLFGGDASINSLKGNANLVQSLCYGSSVVCHGISNADRHCRFTNLCYNYKESAFVFLYGNKSFQSGLPEFRFDQALLDFSSVRDHNRQYFNFADIDSDFFCRSHLINEVNISYGQHLIFKRFKPDNLMHVLHDDLLPVFHTLRLHDSLARGQAMLVLADNHSSTVFTSLYERLNVRNIMDLRSMRSGWVCFEQAIVGLSKETIWYQYGFSEFQGPVHENGFNVEHLEAFRNDFVGKMCSRSSPVSSPDIAENIRDNIFEHGSVLLFSRKYTRRIVNEAEVGLALAQLYNRPVRMVGLETNTVEELICLVSEAKVLVGMHGSLMSLSLFLPRGASLIEIFPFAVNPDNYTPYKTLAWRRGLLYRPWENKARDKSIAYPNRDKVLGGINHLRPEEQNVILLTKHVPQHLCCDDPNWLYHIYQDTIVDIKSLMNTLSAKVNAVSARKTGYHIFPSSVTNTSCSVNLTLGHLAVNWSEPWNIRFCKHATVKYHIWLKLGENDIHAYETDATSLFVKGLSKESMAVVWIKCILDDIGGPVSSEIFCQSN